MPTDETRIQEECSSYAQSKLQELDLPPVDTSDMVSQRHSNLV